MVAAFAAFTTNAETQSCTTGRTTMTRCGHPNAYITKLTDDYVAVRCDDCVLLYQGMPYAWTSRHASHRVHAPPKWVQRLIESLPACGQCDGGNKHDGKCYHCEGSGRLTQPQGAQR